MLESLTAQLGTGESFSLLTLLYVYLAGVLTSFTPCVYPLIPVTLSLFGASADSPTGKRMALAATYVVGIASTYTTLGVVSAQSGMVFGSLLAHPFFIILITLLLTVLALSLLDAFDIPGIHRLQNRANSLGTRGFTGAFVMGCMSGIVAAPCVSPVLAGVLIIAAEGQDVFWGGLLLFTYAIGIGSIFLLLATFSGLLTRIPRSGNWLYAIKFVIATALFAVALWMAKPLLDDQYTFITTYISSYFLLVTAFFALIGALFAYKRSSNPLKIVSCIFLACALFLGTLSSAVPTLSDATAAIHWHKSSESALKDARVKNQITMIDIWASWCTACLELEKLTFPDPHVQEQLKQLSLAKVNYEDEGDLIDEYGVLGLPCILFIDKEGKEIPNSRVNGFLPAPEFAKHLRIVLKAFTKVSSE